MIKNIKKLITALSIISFCIFLSGCGPTNQALVRFQSVPIPTYETNDYEELLMSEDREIQANAISNLIPHASTYARILGQGNSRDSGEQISETETDSYARAQKVFTTVRNGLQSDDENIKAASLMFFAEFSPLSPEKKILFALVSQVNSNDVRTQYEQLRTLILLIDPDTNIERAMLDGFLSTRSWLIRSMTYQLLSHIACEDFHSKLLRDYRNSTQDYDKLLILQAFRRQYGPEVFDLLKEELLVSSNLRIQMAAADILPGNRNETAVSQWLLEYHHDLNDELVQHVIDRYASELATPKGTAFFKSILNYSNVPTLTPLIIQSPLFSKLYHHLGQEPQRDDLIEFREAVRKNEALQKQWDNYAGERFREEEEQKTAEELRRKILPKYIELLATFIEDTRRLLSDFGMSPEEIEAATKEMRELLQLFHDETVVGE